MWKTRLGFSNDIETVLAEKCFEFSVNTIAFVEMPNEIQNSKAFLAGLGGAHPPTVRGFVDDEFLKQLGQGKFLQARDAQTWIKDKAGASIYRKKEQRIPSSAQVEFLPPYFP